LWIDDIRFYCLIIIFKIYIFDLKNIYGVTIMDDPVKLIWKFKNNNRRTQYNIFVFVGKLVPSNIMKILEKIKDLKLYDSLIELDKNEIKKLEKIYGDKWYLKFFNTYHVMSTIFFIKESSTKKQEIINKFGEEWYEKHISNGKMMDKKIIYSYETIVKNENIKKNQRKNRGTAIIEDDDEEIDFSIVDKVNIKKLMSKKMQRHLTTDDDESYKKKFKVENINTQKGGMYKQFGGDDEDEEDYEEDYDEDIEEDDDENIVINSSDDKNTDSESELESESESESEEDVDDEYSDEYTQDDIDMEEIEQMYKDDVEPDENVLETTNLIKKALNDDKLFEKKIKQMANFDTSDDNNIYDDDLKHVYKKVYVKSHYIFKDDTVRTLRDKICSSVRCNAKFDEELYLTPSRQYLWSEYTYGNEINKIMIGCKWMRRNELLNVDIEPLPNMRLYEELSNKKLKLLKENIRRYNNRIRREDDEGSILNEYNDYITNNEIYMLDVYNEFGLKYEANDEVFRNIQDIYMKIYFPKIKSEDMKSIFELLNGNKTNELRKTSVIFETINNDILMENEIMNTVENVKLKDSYKDIFKENYVTQSVIHLHLVSKDENKIDLFRIFNEFIVSDIFPFIQYQTSDGNIVYKMHEKAIEKYMEVQDNRNVVVKWFENAPYGISFKMKINDKTGDNFMAIGLTETGKIEYKTRWKEEDMATIDDIKFTHIHVKNLIKKINEEKNKMTFMIPDDSEFKFAFINTIQKFRLPNDYLISHNDLSNFSRYFYPYVSLVIEPRKRKAKVSKGANDKSKFGTYLRYKRVSKYENQSKIEQRIMYFMKNFEYTEKTLINEITKQFNMTESKALEEFEKVKSRYPNLKKSRKILKKLDNVPKYKPPGIGIDIQGKQPDRYKIRISGARDREQLDSIITFMNILIFLYVETYHLKIPERQILKKKLESLKNIAERRSKVDDIVKYSKDIKNVKQMTQVDKHRIGFKPEKGQNQWTRSCQNSGNDKKRRPQQFNSINMDSLIKQGYQLNKKTGNYEKKLISKNKSGKKTETVLRTVKLSEFDDEGNLTGNEIHYTCDPKENGEHFYVGFLTRSTNPFGHCMPCCFKKDPMISKNKEKAEFYKKCLGQVSVKNTSEEHKVSGDRLYILQDTNKIQEGRFGFLPKYLDIYFNHALNKTKNIKHHYLVTTETGYFFKYGSKQHEYQFLNAITSLFDVTLDELKDNIINVLEKDKNDQIFTSLNNGDIKTQFETKEEYISYIKTSSDLDYDIMNNILSVPDILSKKGLTIILFHKQNITIRKSLEKEKIREDFVIQCQDPEEVNDLIVSQKDSCFIIKDGKNYYPIVMVTKVNENTKDVDISKVFKHGTEKNNIIEHVNDFYSKNCVGTFMNTVVHKNSSLTTKSTHQIISKISDKIYSIKYQYIDVRNKCKYLITHNGMIIPVRPSGSMYEIPIIKKIDKYITDFKTTFEFLAQIYKSTDKELPVKPIGVYYDNFTDETKKYIIVNAVMTKTHDVVPVTSLKLDVKYLNDNKLLYINRPYLDHVDVEIAKGRSNYIIDDRIMSVNRTIYEDESYQLFRLEFSDHVNQSQNISLKTKIEKIMNNKKITKNIKYDHLRAVIYKLIDKNLYDMFKNSFNNNDSKQGNKKSNEFSTEDSDFDSMTSDISSTESYEEQTGGKGDRFIHIASKYPDVSHYKINNDRSLCGSCGEKDKCNDNIHCHWTNTGCNLSVTKKMIIQFVNKMSEELSLNNLKAFEIMNYDGYFVSDIVDNNKFTERAGQKIIRNTSNTIQKSINETFGEDTILTKMGKRRLDDNDDVNFQQLNETIFMTENKQYYLQEIIPNNLTIFRSYVNGYYWIKNKYSDVDSRNLGHYSSLQTDLSNYFRSLVIDWLSDDKNKKIILDMFGDYIKTNDTKSSPIDQYIMKLTKDVSITTNCLIELHVLSKINNIPIVIYNEYDSPMYIFVDGMVYNHLNNKQIDDKYSKYTQKNHDLDIINMRFILNGKIPETIEIMYFKN
jgi:hypothetical protein